MLKKTLIASALSLGLICATSGVQANPLTNAISGFINGAGLTDVQFDARRGGGARRASSRRSSSSRSSSKAVTTTNNKSSSTSNNSSTTNNTSNTNKTNQQQDAQFSQQARTGNTNTANTPATTTTAPTGAAPAAAASGPGLGGTFVSSLAGAGAGVILGNMLMSSSAAAAEGGAGGGATEVATPDMLSDDQLSECLTQLDSDIKDVEAKLLETPEEEQAKLRDQLSQMNNLKITLKKEQINRLQQEIQADSNS